MVSEEEIKDIRDRVDRQHRELYKAVKILTREMMDLNYSNDDIEKTYIKCGYFGVINKR